VGAIEDVDWQGLVSSFSVVLANQVFHYLLPAQRLDALRGAYLALKAPGLLVYGDRVIGAQTHYAKRFDELVSLAQREVKLFERTVAEPMDLPFFQYDAREHTISADSLIAEVVAAGFAGLEIVWRRLNYMVVAAIKE
jgi:hypothetical protein